MLKERRNEQLERSKEMAGRHIIPKLAVKKWGNSGVRPIFFWGMSIPSSESQLEGSLKIYSAFRLV
jgi:hypothetical protein